MSQPDRVFELIQPKFLDYLKSQNYSIEKIRNAWSKAVALFPDQLTREVACRDLLRGRAKIYLAKKRT
jgi:hypothetical protein